MSRQRVLLISDLHYCQEEYGGISRDEKAERILGQINEEHNKDPFSLILFLGDYSLDHWGWNTKGSWLVEGKSYTQQFVDRYCQNLPAPFYMLPGNHEQYGQELWRQITGCNRSGEFVVGDYLFILWDSYGADLDPLVHSDGTYTPPDVAQIRRVMDLHPNKAVILCSHSFQPSLSPEECALIRDPRVVCLFQGHTHQSNVRTLPEEYGGKKLIQTGAWASTGPSGSGSWGLRELYLEKDRITSAYLVCGQRLAHGDLPYTVTARRQDEIEIPVAVKT